MDEGKRPWTPGLFTIPGVGTGYVDNRGRIDMDGKTIAYIQPDGMIKAPGGSYIGRISKDGTVYAFGGSVVGNTHYEGGTGDIGRLTYQLTQPEAEAPSGGGIGELLSVITVLLRSGWPFILGALAVGAVLVGMYWGLPLLGKLGNIADWWWIAPLAVSLLLLVWGAVRQPDAPRTAGTLKRIGAPILLVTLLYLGLIKLGLAAFWAFPLDFITSGEIREELMGVIDQCPGIVRMYRGYIHFVEHSEKIVLTRSLSGIFDAISNANAFLMRKLPVLIAFVLVVLNTIAATGLEIILILVLPIIFLILPFALPVLLWVLVLRFLYRE